MMARSRCAAFFWLLLSLPVSFNLAANARANGAIWTGPTISFTKTTAAPTDFITSNAWITRGSNQGIYNLAKEPAYVQFTSPADTEWATCFIGNSCGSVSATNGPSLTYFTWADAYGGSGQLSGNILNYAAVVHLKTDDVYLDLTFTQFGGGGFSYNRSTPPPPNGDYNHNGFVDAADYAAWRRTLNQPASYLGGGADGNGNSTIDLGDYSFWRQHFGNVISSSGGGLAAVPETASIFISLQLFAIVYCTARLRRQNNGGHTMRRQIPCQRFRD